jgi:acyl-CoA synthetase (AMP-forming)/AMP-acid ligase II
MSPAAEGRTVTTHAALLSHAARRHRDATAFVDADNGQSISYDAFHRQALQLARHLVRQGLCPGDMGGILMSNRIEALVADFAMMLCGVGRVLLMPGAEQAEIEEKLGYLQARVIVTEVASAERAAAARRSLPALVHVVSVGGGEGADSFKNVLSEDLSSVELPEVEPAAPCCLRFTSGTTGKPKAVLHDHGSFAAVTANQLFSANWGDVIRPGDRFLQYLPLPVGPVFWIYSCFVAGATTVLTTRSRGQGLLDVIEQEKISVTFFPPSQIVSIALDESVDPGQLSSLRTAFYGGTPLTSSEYQSAQDKFGNIFIHYYAASEYPLCTITNQPPDPSGGHREGSCGRVALGSEVRIVGEDDQPVDTGDVGELLVRGQHVFQEYWNDPDATAQVKLRQGWTRLGDMAYQDADGYIFLVDRKHDAARVDGNLVFPSLIEEALFGPDVAEVAVVGIPLDDGSDGHRLVAFVRYIQGAGGSEQTLRERCEPRLAPHEVPTEFVQHAEPLPRSPLGKVLKRQLAQELVA